MQNKSWYVPQKSFYKNEGRHNNTVVGTKSSIFFISDLKNLGRNYFHFT